MRINGAWVGWGLGDNSSKDMTVKNFKAFARRMYRSYMGDLADTNAFDQQLYDRLVMMQDRLVSGGQLKIGEFIRGVLDLETEYASGFRKRPPPALPIVFTVEGHMSDMFVGPCASVASTLERMGLIHWKPIWYNVAALPFDNQSGINELVHNLSGNTVEGPPVDINNPDGPKVLWPFGSEIPWGIIGFSQGGMIVSDFMEQKVLNGPLKWRLPSFKRGLAFGNPRRENNKCCSWAFNPPRANTQGIMDHLFVTTGTPIADKWAEHANKGDMFAENTTDEVGQDKTAIAKIVTENSWIGGQSAIFARVMTLFYNVPAESVVALRAIISAIMFLASNPNPHYSTVADPDDIEWMKGVAA